MWFGDQAAHFGIDAFAKKHGMSALQLRNRVKARPHPSWSTKRLSSLFGRSMAIGGLGLYIHAVIEAFSTNTTVMDKVAAVTAIVPLVGCGTQAVAVNLKNQANQQCTFFEPSLQSWLMLLLLCVPLNRLSYNWLVSGAGDRLAGIPCFGLKKLPFWHWQRKQ
ncbi:Heat-labile enterotoxin, A chain [Ophiocordyceps camponoti-floridani]|uniref:Heat-labile enterotoxin, A chain n=1 Tax=Ophiocordyceps camponoti-floridani TaxID=2030778 RepID=A0A8H4QB10_9HYPO|nr:Heat-labile enterotoxin, A chain [Ophiocordyceps camponoti-floridani]